MKLTTILRNLFSKKEKELTISEILERANNTVQFRTVGKRTWKIVYIVCDIDNGYKAISESFDKRADAIRFAETTGKRWMLSTTEEEVKGGN